MHSFSWILFSFFLWKILIGHQQNYLINTSEYKNILINQLNFLNQHFSIKKPIFSRLASLFQQQINYYNIPPKILFMTIKWGQYKIRQGQ